jgi:hypothetical protein
MKNTIKQNKIQLKAKRGYKKWEQLFWFKKLTDISKQNTSLLKTSMFLQTALAAETHLARAWLEVYGALDFLAQSSPGGGGGAALSTSLNKNFLFFQF